MVGDGNLKPVGIMTSNKVATYEGTLGGTTQVDALIQMMSKLASRYDTNARWLLNNTTLAYIRTLKDGQNNYLWQPSIIPGVPGLILGKPYTVTDHIDSIVDETFTLVPGATPLAYGDFKAGYTVVDRQGIRLQRLDQSPPFVEFYSTMRVGGDVVDKNAIIKFKVV